MRGEDGEGDVGTSDGYGDGDGGGGDGGEKRADIGRPCNNPSTVVWGPGRPWKSDGWSLANWLGWTGGMEE